MMSRRRGDYVSWPSAGVSDRSPVFETTKVPDSYTCIGFCSWVPLVLECLSSFTRHCSSSSTYGRVGRSRHFAVTLVGTVTARSTAGSTHRCQAFMIVKIALAADFFCMICRAPWRYQTCRCAHQQGGATSDHLPPSRPDPAVRTVYLRLTIRRKTYPRYPDTMRFAC
ncbi:hypothetical protein N658DRAFT_277705 [Parathielavia hyrcaniae]|uniref:Uncharacterized protein n=1 Tax=Parathielavia hyrcaniae TaxID=113614 RepID=A0AAN6T396_9PEZI|nr:hypothetical protein N658DRAFT_277705 [Parathielavia hyrcaniae]